MNPHSLYRLFFSEEPVDFETLNTSHGDNDFREVLIYTLASGEKRVIKLADNDFTFPAKIEMWKRTAEEYRGLGYYCPAIFADHTGIFPMVEYQGHECVAYAEEYAPYIAAQQRDGQGELAQNDYEEQVWVMTARMAARYWDYSSFPSGYCLFDTFCPSDETDEVLENALNWKHYADKLPQEVQDQVQRIWQLWTENRKQLEAIYHELPSSVFQADLNPTNILLDDRGAFVGVFDFNLCGREVFLNYLFREVFNTDFAQELERILKTLKVVSRYYQFSVAEKNAALMLYRCLKPLWFNKLQKLKKLKSDMAAVKAYLAETEYYLTEPIPFEKWMG